MIAPRRPWCVALLCCLAWLVPDAAYALALAVAPARAEVQVPAGGAASFEVQVLNKGSEPLPLRMYAWDLWYDDTHKLFAPPGTQPRSAAGWVQIVPRDAVLPAGERLDLLVTVSAPPEATGGAYAMVFVESIPGPDAPSGRAGARMGIQVLTSVAGTGARQIRVGDASFRMPTETRPAAVLLDVVNRGDVHLSPTFHGLIRTSDGELLGRIGSEGRPWLLPGEHTALTMQWTQPMEPGAYELVGTVVYGENLAVPVVIPLLVNPPQSAVARPPG